MAEVIQEASQQIEGWKARDERKRKKASLIQHGLSEVSSYLLQLRHEDEMSSEEYWDSEFREDLIEAVKQALGDEITGDESSKEVKEFVRKIIDSELEIE